MNIAEPVSLYERFGRFDGITRIVHDMLGSIGTLRLADLAKAEIPDACLQAIVADYKLRRQ